jgi:membrane protease YdiL (CAAX protease family)
MVLVGAAFGWLALRADRLGPAITAHVTFNLLAIGLLVADGVV